MVNITFHDDTTIYGLDEKCICCGERIGKRKCISVRIEGKRGFWCCVDCVVLRNKRNIEVFNWVY